MAFDYSLAALVAIIASRAPIAAETAKLNLKAAVSMPIWGPGSDRWGRRRTYLVGIVAFTAGSGLRAVATAESAVFSALQSEYRLNPRMVRERVYREALEEVMNNIGKRYFLPPKSRPGNVRIFVSEAESPP